MLGSANGHAHAEALSEVRKADAAEREVLEAPSELPSMQVSHCLSKLGPGDAALDSQTSKLIRAYEPFRRNASSSTSLLIA
jgi:hypothetical protein